MVWLLAGVAAVLRYLRTSLVIVGGGGGAQHVARTRQTWKMERGAKVGEKILQSAFDRHAGYSDIPVCDGC